MAFTKTVNTDSGIGDDSLSPATAESPIAGTDSPQFDLVSDELPSVATNYIQHQCFIETLFTITNHQNHPHETAQFCHS